MYITRAVCVLRIKCASNYSWRLFGDLVSPIHPIGLSQAFMRKFIARLSGFCLSTIYAKAFETHKKHVHRLQCNLFHINTITTHLFFSSSLSLWPSLHIYVHLSPWVLRLFLVLKPLFAFGFFLNAALT